MIQCNRCDAKLSEPTPQPGYYLSLRSVRKPNTALMYTIFVTPEIDGELHFCDLECLTGYFHE